MTKANNNFEKFDYIKNEVKHLHSALKLDQNSVLVMRYALYYFTRCLGNTMLEATEYLKGEIAINTQAVFKECNGAISEVNCHSAAKYHTYDKYCRLYLRHLVLQGEVSKSEENAAFIGESIYAFMRDNYAT